MNQEQFRTHTCGELTKEHEGQHVMLSGWVHSRRNLGGLIFIDVRDHFGITQVTFDPEKNKEAWEVANTMRTEFVFKVTGTVNARPENMINDSMATGTIELLAESAEILCEAETTPFEIEKAETVNEELRLKHRYLDLRFGKSRENILLRSKVVKYIRDWMHEKGFIEIDTPLLTASSPEGARDFLVPSRLHQGKFFALPQAPQQYKQLLMASGFDKYFQIAPCMRDEDARADRSVGEFYQLDVETSFLTQEEFFQLMEPLFVDVVKNCTEKEIQQVPFPRISYNDVMNRFGSDKPDLRFGLEFVDVTEVVKDSDFKVFNSAESVKGICATGAGDKIGRNEIDKVMTPLAVQYGAKGLAWMRVTDDGVESSIAKFFTDEKLQELVKAFDAQSGDYLFFIADSWKVTCEALGAVRSYCGEKLELADPNVMAFAWVVDFPMYELDDETGKVDFSHNPFSMPQGGMDDLMNKDPLDILAYQYDIVCNGYELSSGAVRNYQAEIMYKAFEIAGYSKSDVDDKFGHMITAFSYGAPPHCGFAPGIERFVMLLVGENRVREVVAFPKNSKGQDMVVGAPAEIDEEQLDILGLQMKKKK